MNFRNHVVARLVFFGAMMLTLSSSLPLAATALQRHDYTIPHTLRMATSEEIAGLNPHLNTQISVGYLDQMTMAYLLKFDKHDNPRPELATSVPTKTNGGISKDGLSITYHLVKNAKWSDGVPFDAQDVAFSFKAVLNPKNNETSRTGFDLITAIETPDKFTVTVHLRRPFAAYAPTFFGTEGANPCILPKHILGGLPDINHAAYNDLPVGIGPFKFKEWKRGDHVTLVADPLYFGKKPKLKRVILKIIPDRNTTLNQLQSHEIDLWLPITASYYDRVRGLQGVTAVSKPGYSYDHLDFNLSNPDLQDVRVRRALLLAVDRRSINQKIRHGLGVVQEPVLPPSHPAFPRNIGTTEFNLAEAGRLLDSAGWVPDSARIRHKDGRRLEFRFATSTGSPDADQQIEIIRADWASIGVRIDVRKYDSALMFGPRSEGGIIYSGIFDIVSFNWSVDPLGDVTYLFECGQAPPEGQNVMGYCNRDVDRLLEDWKTHYTFEERQSDIDRALRLIARDVPTLVIDFRPDIYAFNSDLTGFAPNNLSKFDDIVSADI